ncbi:GAF and ANTAR domain-containing protein [Saccharothrix sp. AJ9571]|nr:GAF and ANTAR domain-containing protein [Saccharothrix sp. AJ9571]
MIVERPDPLARLDATTEAVLVLQEIAAAEEPLDDVLGRVGATAARALPGADGATITVLTGEEPRTAAWTDRRLVDIDAGQYAGSRGPCLEAARTHRTVRTVVSACHRQWPEFAAAAEEAGIRATLSAPLLVGAEDGGELVGSLNIYSRTAAAFDPFDEGLLRLYTAAAAAAIINARRWQQSREKTTGLETALTSRAEIDQAKGILMALHGYSADEAFAQMVKQSQHSQIKVNQLARNLLASVRIDGEAPST